MYWVAGGFLLKRSDSVVHRLDPRVKLLISIELFSVSLLSATLPQIMLTLAFIFLLAALGRLVKRFFKTILVSAGLAVTIFVLNVLVNTPLTTSIVLSLRFIAIIGSTSIFFLTTSPDELEQVMKWFRLPRDIVFAFVTAVRFVPVILLDAIQITDAQKSRGLEVEKGGLFKRARNFVPILIPLIVTAVIRSNELAEAMESRAYGATKKPTSLYTLKLKRFDVSATVLSILIFSVFLFSFPALG